MHTAKSRPVLGCIADDFTGATDLASTLVRGGMRTIQTIGVPVGVDEADEVDALVVALKSRTIAAEDAIAQSLAALDWLRAQGCRQFFFKYCSTFDSTDAGNIGPVAEALLDALAASSEGDFAIACPAFPENGRTVYRGHLFVGDALLSESGMENHPLTPMRDPNLVRVLQRQSKSKVGLIASATVAAGVDAVREAIARLRADGVRLAIADALTDADLRTLGEACADLPLITGGSGVAIGLPENFRRAGLIEPNDRAADLPAVDGAALVLAGSASKATNAQVAEWIGTRPAYRVDPRALAHGEDVVGEALAFIEKQAPQPVLIYATAAPGEVAAVQREFGVAAAGKLVEDALAAIAREAKARGVRKFVVAGGETSGAVVQALGVDRLLIGPTIDPGVPVTVALGETPLALALKSGNFGARDFFAKALRYLDGARA
ncbi:HPr kinase [Caballeronia hypogeia]|uniref:3-oxo-tetronate kinase n=1 Tax=Caballeronia hypogeia TaxID=1777140 RepID=A0A158BW51_9BURK|nr:3-oxo-tetronate kinase [Caballeronia hypogeia]SAK73906.1 HPr kinase [Caballeronia hypogeia]